MCVFLCIKLIRSRLSGLSTQTDMPCWILEVIRVEQRQPHTLSLQSHAADCHDCSISLSPPLWNEHVLEWKQDLAYYLMTHTLSLAHAVTNVSTPSSQTPEHLSGRGYVKMTWVLTQTKILLSNFALWMLCCHPYSETDI